MVRDREKNTMILNRMNRKQMFFLSDAPLYRDLGILVRTHQFLDTSMFLHVLRQDMGFDKGFHNVNLSVRINI